MCSSDRRDTLTPETAKMNGHPTPRIVKMSVDEIMNGSESFPGLIPLIKKYLKSMEVDVDTQCTINHYLNLISKRAKGEFLTTATWIRNFVLNHPDYKKDSKVSQYNRNIYTLFQFAYFQKVFNSIYTCIY